MFSLPPATKLGQGNIFRSVCQEFCSQGGVAPSMHCRWYPSMPCSRSRGRGWYPSVPCRFPGPHPGGKLRGIWPVVSPGPHQGVSIPACTEADPPDGYCCGRYASYWIAFLFYFTFIINVSTSTW